MFKSITGTEGFFLKGGKIINIPKRSTIHWGLNITREDVRKAIKNDK